MGAVYEQRRCIVMVSQRFTMAPAVRPQPDTSGTKAGFLLGAAKMVMGAKQAGVANKRAERSLDLQEGQLDLANKKFEATQNKSLALGEKTAAQNALTDLIIIDRMPLM